jgi:hypothetical protein
MLNLEEVILSVLLVKQLEQKEDNCQSPQDKSFYYLHVFICYLKLMLDLKINKADTEKDI